MKEKKNAIMLEDVCIHYSIMNNISIRKTFLHKKKRNDKMIKNGEAGRHTDDNHKQSSGKTVITQLYRCFLKINPYFVLLITVKR